MIQFKLPASLKKLMVPNYDFINIVDSICKSIEHIYDVQYCKNFDCFNFGNNHVNQCGCETIDPWWLYGNGDFDIYYFD